MWSIKCAHIQIYIYVHRYTHYKSVQFCASCIAMDLYPGSASDSELDGCGNLDYDEDLDCDCEQVISSSKASVLGRNCYSEKKINSGKACSPATKIISGLRKCESNGCVLACLDRADSPDSW